MKVRALSRYTRDAIARTLGHVEDKNRRAPTWDGKTLHVRRIAKEAHVLHEVAHWLASKPHHRALPNYGLGGDPDGGPKTKTFHLADIEAGRVDEGVALALHNLAVQAPEDLYALYKAGLNHQEELASVVTIVLLRLAGLDWESAMRDVFGDLQYPKVVSAGLNHFWSLIHELAARGVDLEDPVRPFARRKAAA